MAQSTQNQATESPFPVGIRKVGQFCWINILTPNPVEAMDFFTKVLGWSYAEMPANMGHVIKVGGRDMGGLFDLNSPQTPPGTHPHIGVMVKVKSADATVEKVTSLGGKAMPAFDVMDKGRMAVCFDPNGAAFDVWEPKASQGADVDSTQHGATSWFETMTSDKDRAMAFYDKLFGWKAEAMATPNMNYYSFKHEGLPIAGMLQITPEMGNMPSVWLTYFTVKNIDESVKLATQLGARMCMDIMAVPTVGRFSMLTSPQGVMFYMIQYIP